MGSFSLFDGYGCAALASNTAVPDVSVTLDAGTNALPNDFSAQPLSGQETLGPVQYYKKHYPKDTTVGAIVSDVASAKTQMAQQFAGLKSQGYKIAYVDDVNPLASDFTTDVINMKNKGVNAVDLTGIDWQDAAIFVENANTQNWHPGLIFSGGPSTPTSSSPTPAAPRRPTGSRSARSTPSTSARTPTRCRRSSSSTPT